MIKNFYRLKPIVGTCNNKHLLLNSNLTYHICNDTKLKHSENQFFCLNCDDRYLIIPSKHGLGSLVEKVMRFNLLDHEGCKFHPAIDLPCFNACRLVDT